MKEYTYEYFIECANKCNGDRRLFHDNYRGLYDYSKSCGWFSSYAWIKKSRLMSSDDFIKRCISKHGQKFDYSKVEYNGYFEKVCIICNTCGYEFWTTPNSHLSGGNGCGCGCPKCSIHRDNKYSDDYIIEHGKLYKTSNEFYKNEKHLYSCALRRGLLNTLNDYWKPVHIYWDYDKCKHCASLCKNRTEFMRRFGGAYRFSRKNGWLDEFFPINYRDNDAKIHCVYQIYFKETNSIYIGRTLVDRIILRNNEHKTDPNSAAYRHSKYNNIDVPDVDVICDCLDVNESLYYEDYLRKNLSHFGFNILNIAKTGVKSGSIGRLGSGKWRKNSCAEVASMCKSPYEMSRRYSAAYKNSYKFGWLDEFFPNRQKKRKLSDDLFRKEVIKYNSRIKFFSCDSSLYKYGYRNGLLDEFFPKK